MRRNYVQNIIEIRLVIDCIEYFNSLYIGKDISVKQTIHEDDARVYNEYDDGEEIYQKKFVGHRHNSMERSRFQSKFQNNINSSMRNRDRASDGALNLYNDIFHNYPPFANG